LNTKKEEISRISSGCKAISHTHIIINMDRTRWIDFNLFTDMADMYRDDRPYLKRFFVPGMAVNLLRRKGMAGMVHQKVQDLKLLGSQMAVSAIGRDTVLFGIQKDHRLIPIVCPASAIRQAHTDQAPRQEITG
jgi:hypothetical protein